MIKSKIGIFAGLVLVAAGAGGAEPGIVSHIKVLSEHIEDVSSLEAWKKSFIKEGMSEEEKALAVWKSVVKFQLQDSPPREYLQCEDLVLDPIKEANVYGYSYCSVAASSVQCLGRFAGLKARGWTINRHVVPELFYLGQWRMLDSSLIAYFPKSDGKPAGVEEIVAGVKEWRAAHPEIAEGKLNAFMRGGGWRNGPEVLSRCPFYDENGWLPAATHGWYSTMEEYGGKTLTPYEAGYSQGYSVNIQLREGERITRNWANKGLHINMEEEKSPPAAMTQKVGADMLRYSPGFGDLAPGRLGNGTLEYNLPLASGAFRKGALLAENLAASLEEKAGAAVHVKAADLPGILILRMPSSYVYLGGELSVQAAVPNGGAVGVFFSGNNGLDWKEIASLTASGQSHIDLKPLVFRRYDYRLKFILKGKGTGLDQVKITHDIQHSQRALPALAIGSNAISFSADEEGTMTIEGATETGKSRQLVYTDFHPELKNISNERLQLSGGTGEAVFPIETPGAITRLRIGAFYRARDKADAWEVLVSFDEGKSFKNVERLAGPFVGMGKCIVVSDVPGGARRALVKFAGSQRNTLMFYNLRIDADYREPQGGFRPLKVTYEWEENGQIKHDVHIARAPDERYGIECAQKPSMKSISFEIAQ